MLRAQFKGAHDLLEGTTADVTAEVLTWSPPGNANSVGGNYAHVVVGEDFLLHGAQGKAPLLAGECAGKTGLSEPPPAGADMHEWDKRVTIDLDALRQYAQAVYADTDAYLSSLADADLAVEHDFSALGFGKQTLGSFLSLLLGHVGWHTGEVAVLKGVQGKKGYPF